MKKKKTIEQQLQELIHAVKLGFDETTRDIHGIKNLITLLSDGQDIMRADIEDIKRTLGPLVQASAYFDRQLREHDKRIERLERKVGAGK